MFSNYFFRKTKIIHVKFNKNNIHVEELKMVICLSILLILSLLAFMCLLILILNKDHSADIEIDALEQYYKGLTIEGLKDGK